MIKIPGAQTLFDPNSIRHYAHIKQKSVHKRINFSDGTKLTVDINDIIGFRAAINKKWDSTCLNLVKKLYTSKLIFIDVGANIGATCIPIANLDLQIIAFEANQDTVQLLFKNISDNSVKKAIVFPFALGAELHNGKYMKISTPIGNISSASLVNNWSHGKDPVKNQNTYMSTLDNTLSMLTLMNGKKDIILKIDVEGFELHVINGSLKTIKKHRPLIVFENNPASSKNSIRVFKDMINKLSNYKIFEITEENLLLDFNPRLRYENAILVPNEKLKSFN
jgi:FkbM family methyltransferase